MHISSIPEILDDYRAGRPVIITDDEDRENEGDVLVAADMVTPEHINFMATHARGLICLALTEARCRQLGLSLMVNNNASRFTTNFTASIEAARGVTTGISAPDRAATVRAAVHPDARPGDVVSPGHVFPIMARPGGVLTRAGHTEAGVDLARLAGLQPASVMCEVLKEDGTMARFADLKEFAARHGLKMSSVAELIRYRLTHEPTIKRVAEGRIATRAGDFRIIAYNDIVENETHIALTRGELSRDRAVLVRVHVESGLYDLFRELQGDAGWSLDAALRRISKEDSGVLIILRYHDSGEEIIRSVKHANADDQPVAIPWREEGQDLRMLGVGGQILNDLGVGKMRVLGAPKRMHALSGFGLEIVDYVSRESD